MRCVPRPLPSAGVRLLLGAVGFVGVGLAVDASVVGPREASWFRRVNGLPDALGRPAQLVSPSGSVWAVPAAAGAAWLAGDRTLTSRLAVAGAGAWLAAKAVKRRNRRARPGVLLTGVRHRGRAVSGGGYVSAHTAVATALAVTALPALNTTGRLAAAVAVPLVAGSRVYLGAHLPLDVAAGAALGLAVGSVVELATAGWPAR